MSGLHLNGCILEWSGPTEEYLHRLMEKHHAQEIVPSIYSKTLPTPTPSSDHWGCQWVGDKGDQCHQDIVSRKRIWSLEIGQALALPNLWYQWQRQEPILHLWRVYVLLILHAPGLQLLIASSLGILMGSPQPLPSPSPPRGCKGPWGRPIWWSSLYLKLLLWEGANLENNSTDTAEETWECKRCPYDTLFTTSTCPHSRSLPCFWHVTCT